MPCIVRDLTDEEATILMVDTNVQREEILPSERAFAFKMKLDAIKRQGKRVDLTSTPVRQKLSVDIIAEEFGMSREQVRRFIRLTVFCAEHFVDSTTGNIEEAIHIKPVAPKMKEACKVACFGQYNKYPDYFVDGGILAADMKWVKQDYVFTQQMIWEVLGQSNATFIS